MATATIENRTTQDEELRLFKFNTRQYYVMAELGWFEFKKNHKIELLDGEVWEQYPDHADEPRSFRFSCEQYEQMDELGWFEDAHVQLLDGEVVEMSPIGSRHAAVTGLISSQLQRVFGMAYHVRVQMPIRFLALNGEPEPDVAVVRGAILDYLNQNPTGDSTVLVIEVAESTVRTDRIRKAALYVSAGIQEYWIANLSSNQLEIHRQPAYDESGARYLEKTFLTREQSVHPLEAPKSKIKVSDLLP